MLVPLYCSIACAFLIVCALLALFALENRVRFKTWIDKHSINFANISTWVVLWVLFFTNIWVGQMIYFHSFA